jgi:endonuclease/exonuclease/phosphatase family metal-dependent hydrolase
MQMQRSKFMRIVGVVFNILTLALLIAYTLALSGSYFSPAKWAVGGIFNMGLVYGWMGLLMLSIAWFFKNIKVGVLMTLLLVVGIKPFYHSFSFNTKANFKQAKHAQAIRVMQWNCEELGGNLSWETEKNAGRKNAADFILAYSPDVVCMQDYVDSRGKFFKSNESFLKDTLGYPYRVFGLQSGYVKKYGILKCGLNIVSKLPIAAHGVYYYTGLTSAEAILWADVVFQGKKVRIATTHFRSFYLRGSEFFEHEKPASIAFDKEIVLSKNIFKKLSYFQKQHSAQALQLRAFLDTCSVPVILSADLNTLPSSYLYGLVKSDFKDSFRGNAFGFGATYNYLLPNIRIDYQFYHPSIKLIQWKHFTNGFFDHDHLLGDFSLPSTN